MRLLFGLILLILGWLSYDGEPVKPDVDQPITRIEIDKSEREMITYSGDQAIKTYRIALGFAPVGDKEQEGDGKTPEGRFTINRRNPQSSFHLSLGIDYPQAEDIARAAAAGVSPGGDIFIHGQPNRVADWFMVPGDWTAGCIAVTNAEIRELWEHAEIGTEVIIRP